jgi:hypothetical protein
MDTNEAIVKIIEAVDSWTKPILCEKLAIVNQYKMTPMIYTLENHEERETKLMNAINAVSESNDDQVRRLGNILFLIFRTKCFADMKILPSIDCVGTFSYSKNSEDADEKRVRTTLGRILRRQVKLTPDMARDDVLAKAADIIIRTIWTNQTPEVEMLKGEDIVDAYRDYSGDSCMAGDSCEYVFIYSQNPNTVRLMAVFVDGCCVAKALVWNTREGDKILDRVYHEDGYRNCSQSIIREAEKNGIFVAGNPYSRNNSYKRTVLLDISKCETLPYFDSFRFVKSNILVNGRPHIITGNYESDSDIYTMCDTDGDCVNECPHCHERYIGNMCQCPWC